MHPPDNHLPGPAASPAAPTARPVCGRAPRVLTWGYVPALRRVASHPMAHSTRHVRVLSVQRGLDRSACRTNGAPSAGQGRCLGSWGVPQNFLFPQRDQPLLLPVDMREWLPEDDLVFVVLDAVAAVDLGAFYARYRADGHGRAAFDPAMMVALLLYGYCQGERSSRVIEKRCVRDVAYRVITGGLRPDHATIARFRARHEAALGGLFSQVLRLLAAEGMVALGTISLDGTKLAGNASQKRTGRCRRSKSCLRRRPRPTPPRTPAM